MREGMPVQETDMSATDRLVALMDHLRLASAYFGTAIPRDISGWRRRIPNVWRGSCCACRAASTRPRSQKSPIGF